MSEWIKCSDRLPEIDQQAWISFLTPWGAPDRGQAYGIYLGDGDWYWDVSESGDLLSRSEALKIPETTVCYVTHWMPLPAPPAD